MRHVAMTLIAVGCLIGIIGIAVMLLSGVSTREDSVAAVQRENRRLAGEVAYWKEQAAAWKHNSSEFERAAKTFEAVASRNEQTAREAQRIARTCLGAEKDGGK